MNIRRAVIGELDEIMQLIKLAIDDMQQRGIDQWDNIYPNKKVITEDILDNNLFVYEDGGIKGIIVLNEHQDEEYKAVNWKYQNVRALVIHRLCISPQYQGKGAAKVLVKFADEHARKNGYASIRLDTFIYNERACRLYKSFGYEIVGKVNFRKGEFYCFEKSII